MSTLSDDIYNFTFPCPSTPPEYSYDTTAFVDMSFKPAAAAAPAHAGHSRTTSNASSVYSLDSSPPNSVATASTRRTTPSRSPVVRTHGPLLLPKIRTQDQTMMSGVVGGMAPMPIAQASIQQSSVRPTKRARTTPPPPSRGKSSYRPGHTRSVTSPANISFNPNPAMTYSPPMAQPQNCSPVSNFLASPISFPEHDFTFPQTQPTESRHERASSCNLDDATIDKFGFPTYRQMPMYAPVTVQAGSSATMTPKPAPAQAPAMMPVSSQPDMSSLPAPSSYFQPYTQQSMVSRAESPLAAAAPVPLPVNVAPEVPATVQAVLPPAGADSTTMLSYLTSANPAPSLVRTIAFPLRDPHAKHFWWDVRQVRPWTSFNASTLLSLSNGSAASLLTCPLPTSYLPTPMTSQRHPETETALHGIYANYYLPKLNAALALSSNRPIQLSVPSKTGPHATRDTEQMFTASIPGDVSTAAAIFGGKPSARVVGLVKSFDRFNTGMRLEGNVKRVEYLRGLAHLHHVMREHGSRYGFILTEIELIVVRNGLEGTPHFGFLEVASCQLATVADDNSSNEGDNVPMTACLALWGLCMLASDEPLPAGHAAWRAEIGAPAEGTRKKALARDNWMPAPQLAEKREAKRSRGWVWPEDPVGRKELGKRGVRYGAC